ncbi:hypothetical protein DFJ63DRAFT_312093 [Scheffersomyces coipomensis]|uniref:uncharacterized protein n=1 Tax=Scheffersomyces coipomensis TaxID=1788519 RepID=UPI00315DB703
MNLEESLAYIESFNKFNENIRFLHINDNDNDNNDYNTKSLNPRMKHSLKKQMTLASPLQECEDSFPVLDAQIDPIQQDQQQQQHSQILIFNDVEGGVNYFYEDEDNEQQENPEIEDISPISIASLDGKIRRKRSNSVQHSINHSRNNTIEKYRISKSSNTSPTIKLPLKPEIKIATIENYAQHLVHEKGSSSSNNVGNPFYKPKYKSTTSIPNMVNYSQLAANNEVADSESLSNTKRADSLVDQSFKFNF